MNAIQIPENIGNIAKTLNQNGFQAYVVGGAVRDALLGKAVADWDLATSATPKEVTTLFAKVIPTGIKHGTVTVLTPDPMAVEVTTLRLEGKYQDGRRPDQVVYTKDLNEDLARRDFTINAMAWCTKTNKLFDPYHGQKDLAEKKIRTVGDPLDRFNEDGLRPIRAIRFAAQLGFQIEPKTLAAIPETLATIKKVAIERIREEFMKILQSAQPSVAIELMRDTGILAWLLPELLEGYGVMQNDFHAYDVYYHSLKACDEGPPEPLLRLALLLHDVGKPRTKAYIKGANRFYGHDRLGARMTEKILSRLRFSNDDKETVVNLVKNHMFYYRDNWSNGAVRRFLRKVGEDQVETLMALRVADEKASGVNPPDYARLESLRDRIETLKQEEMALSVKQLAINGRDLMQEFKLTPGPQIGQILNALLEEVIENPEHNNREDLLKLAQEKL